MAKNRGRRSGPAPPPPTPPLTPPPPPPPPPPAPPANVIDITSSPDASTTKGGGGGGGENRTKRAPPSLLDIELDGIEMWTPRQKRRLDEDCCILAADPLAPDVIPTAAAANDDIAVVAERGKVACRDYPHPRSACAKYPFRTTPHENHCEQCFCYVCDVPAPCSSWKGQGGHCHASDKDKNWKVKRTARQKRTQVVK